MVPKSIVMGLLGVVTLAVGVLLGSTHDAASQGQPSAKPATAAKAGSGI